MYPRRTLLRMRKPTVHTAADGTKTWKVRFRSGGRDTSRTFHRKADADTFARIVSGGREENVVDALAWIASKEAETQTATFDQWFEDYVDQLSGITPRTRADYRSMRRLYLKDLDGLPIALITRAHVAAIVNRLDSDGKSPKTIKNVIHLLSSVMAMAVDEGHIPRNPVRRVRLPKQRLIEDEITFLTTEQAGRLVAATPVEYQPLVTFLFGTGLRWSEATALQVKHVSLANGTVRVQRAWKRIPGGWEIGPPKSPKANRTVNAAVAALVAVEPLLGKPDDFLFTTPRGNVVRHANFYNRIWVKSCERAGLIDPRPSPHDCRHSFASWLISDGIGLEAVQDQLGHESYETTRKVYAHLLPAVGVAAGKSASAAMAQVLAAKAAAQVLPLATPQVLESTLDDGQGDVDLDGDG